MIEYSKLFSSVLGQGAVVNLTQENKNKLDDILKIVISTKSTTKSLVLTENTDKTGASDKEVIKSLRNALERISQNEHKIYGAIQEQSKKQSELNDKLQNLQNEVQTVKQAMEDLNKENKANKEKIKTLVDLTATIQGVVAADIANCRSDIQKIFQAL